MLAAGGHGGLNVQGAIAASCDCFFYEAARRAGVDRIGEVAAKLGFGKLSELGLPGESAGNQPSRGWKQEKYSKPWQQGDSFNLGIGQGYMTATPMQLAMMTARIANGGYEVQPNLLLAKATPREELVPPPPRDKPDAPSLRFNPQFINLVRQGMSDVVNTANGTANRCATIPRASCSSPACASPARPARRRSSASPSANARWGSPRRRCPGICATTRCSSATGRSTLRAMPAPSSSSTARRAAPTAGPIGRDVLVETMKRDPSRHVDRFKKMASR